MSYVSTPQGPIESCELRSYFRTCPGNLALFGKNTTDRINPRTGFVNALSKTKHCLGFYLERLTLSERNALKDQPASLILQNMDMTVSKEYISQLHTLFDRHMRDEEVLIVRTHIRLNVR